MKSLSLSVLRIRDFRLLLTVRMCVTMALQAQAMIVGWQIYSITKDPFMLGLAGLAEALPAIGCALFAGHVVDVGHPRKIYAACVWLLALNTAGLFMIAGEVLPFAQQTVLLCLFAGIFMSGVIRSFLAPSMFAMVQTIVSRAEIPAATAWLSAGVQVSIVSGPAAAGLIYGGYGAHGAWMLPVFLSAMGVLAVCFLRTAHRPRDDKRESAIKSIREGWRFIIRTPELFSVMALDMFAVFFGGAVAMLPVYADVILHVGSEGLGALRAAPALGAVATALALAFYPMKRITAVHLLWVVAGFGVCMIGFGLSTAFWLSMGFLFLSGCFDSVSVLIRSNMMQLLTPENMRGRVSSIGSMFIVSSNEIGSFESGTAARLMGLVPSVVFGGVMTLAVVAATAVLSPRMRRTVIDTTKERPFCK